jgi:hypothetical protein
LDYGEMERNRVAENKEKVALKVEKLRGSQPSGSGGKKYPFKSFKNGSWYEMAMQDDKKKENSRSMFKGSEPLEAGQTIMGRIASFS